MEYKVGNEELRAVIESTHGMIRNTTEEKVQKLLVDHLLDLLKIQKHRAEIIQMDGRET